MKIKFKTLNIGGDLLLIITGGKEHIGAITLCENNKLSTIEKVNHKDSVISDMVSKMIYDKLKINVIVICGIHKDNATKKDIKKIIYKSKKITKQWIKDRKNGYKLKSSTRKNIERSL
jgi:hypothetical protein